LRAASYSTQVAQNDNLVALAKPRFTGLGAAPRGPWKANMMTGAHN
jgi:hypothetical protein